MSSATAVEPPPIALPAYDVTVWFNPDGDSNYITVDKPFLSIAVPAIDDEDFVMITWNLTALGSAVAGDDFYFDKPSITFFGETPDLQYLRWSRVSCTVGWRNSTNRRGLSYPYRIHLVRKNADQTLTPISHDPVLHNEPPS
jgi:hypothetical protein